MISSKRTSEIMLEADNDKRDKMIDALTEVEVKSFLKQVFTVMHDRTAPDYTAFGK